MISALFISTAIGYVVAGVLFLEQLFRGKGGIGRRAPVVLSIAAIVHVVYLLLDGATTASPPMTDLHQTLTVLSLGTVVAFLAASWRKPGLRILGAFVTPVTLLFFLASGLGRSVAPVPDEVRSALLPFHIGVNITGVAAFALAFASALAYVIQERMLRRKKIGPLFQRLPALDVLDTLGLRAVLVGFPLLTIGVVTGACWAHRIDQGLNLSQGLGIVAWAVFGGVLILRVALGWRGRRAAYGTITGFFFAVAVLGSYMLRAGSIG